MKELQRRKHLLNTFVKWKRSVEEETQLDWHNQKGFPTPKSQWRDKASATFECLKWWMTALEDISSAHDVEYNDHVEGEYFWLCCQNLLTESLKVRSEAKNVTRARKSYPCFSY